MIVISQYLSALAVGSLLLISFLTSVPHTLLLVFDLENAEPCAHTPSSSGGFGTWLVGRVLESEGQVRTGRGGGLGEGQPE